ncbi:hypothetical protein [Amycolatopsis sp. GM8]|uniref:hypothetical protein n=1 Tax=Amycolatopsis sp. GM8 TaxID=2896530 RepID=UPI001F2904C2|nr:hypothetical protein [Amycolatopsis sp. GM8]
MSIFDVVNRLGTLALIRFALVIGLFLLLHLVRIPLVLLARVIEVFLRRLDRYATRQASPPASPVNNFYASCGEENHRVHG